MKDNLLRVGDFATITTDQFVDKGVKRGHYVYVASLKPLPIEEADPYLQRVFVFVHLMTREGHVEPDKGLFLMDPRQLSKVGKQRHKKFTNILMTDFGENENPNDEVAIPPSEETEVNIATTG